MQPDFNNEGGTFPSLSISISIDIAWLAHSAQPDSLEDKCLIFLRQVGVGAAAGYGPGLATLLQAAGCVGAGCCLLPLSVFVTQSNLLNFPAA